MESETFLTFKLFASSKLIIQWLRLRERGTLPGAPMYFVTVPVFKQSLGSAAPDSLPMIISIIDIFTVKSFIANASQDYLQMIKVNSIDISTYLYGIRSKAFTLFYLVPTLTMSLGVSAVPVISESRAVKENEMLKNSCEFSLKVISFITFPAAIGLTVLAKPIMELLYSSNDVYSINLMALYGIAALFAGFSVPLTSIIQALNLQKKAFLTIVIGIIIKIAVNLLAVFNPKINICAAPIGTIICYLFLTVSMLIILKKSVRNIKFTTCIIKPLISALVCGGCAYLVSVFSSGKIATVFAIILAVITYLIMILITKTFEINEISTIPILKKLVKKH